MPDPSTEDSAGSGAGSASVLIDDFTPAAPPGELPVGWILGPFIALLLFGLLGFLLRKRIRKRIEQMGLPPRPDPVAEARKALADLRSDRERIPPREFVERLSAIFRRYWEQRFAIRATSQTTREFLTAESESSHLGEEKRSVLRTFLESSDRVKFAQAGVSTEAFEVFLDWVEQVIVETDPSSIGEGEDGT